MRSLSLVGQELNELEGFPCLAAKLYVKERVLTPGQHSHTVNLTMCHSCRIGTSSGCLQYSYSSQRRSYAAVATTRSGRGHGRAQGIPIRHVRGPRLREQRVAAWRPGTELMNILATKVTGIIILHSPFCTPKICIYFAKRVQLSFHKKIRSIPKEVQA